MSYLKFLILVGWVLQTTGSVLPALAEESVAKLYLWQGHTLCGEFDAVSGLWLRQVDVSSCGGSEYRLYSWQGHRLCGEFTLKNHQWVQQAALTRCGGSYFETYARDGVSFCGEFTVLDHQWVRDTKDANDRLCQETQRSEWTGAGTIPSGWYTSGPADCASGRAVCQPPELGGACYCE